MARSVTLTVLYPTNASTDPMFIPGNQSKGDNPDSGSKAQRVADCQLLVGQNDDGDEIGKVVKSGTLADW